MTVNHVVVDGSNLATEGRTLPSLQQLDEAVRSYIDEFNPKNVTVIVDASFPNRIDDGERATFEAALEAGELLAPPAGVIGRGDAFLLQIADRADAVVLSNDSFQEFHGQYGWLFDQGRLIGGKPVPHVGWVFMERSPVRGPLSRKSVSEAKKAKKKATKQSDDQPAKKSKATKAATQEPAKKKAAKQRGGRQQDGKQPAKATKQATNAPSSKKSGRRRGGGGGGGGGGGNVEPYNDPLPFIEFVGAHPVGSTVTGEVERFASHGAYVQAEGARAYLPLKNLGDPPPRSAREVLSFGETYTFVVQAFDTPRRGVDLTMQDVVAVTAGDLAAAGSASDPVPDQLTEEERVAPAKKKKAPAKRKAVAKKKAPAKRKAAAKKAPAKRKAAAKKAPAKKKAAKKKAPAKRKAAAKKKAPAKRKAAKKKAPAKKKAAKKKAPAKKKAAKKKAPAKKKAAKKKAPAKRKAAKKKAPAKRKAAKKR